MKQYMMAISLLVLGGCISIVDETQEGRRIRSFIVTSDETLDLMERIDKVSPEQKRLLFKAPEERNAGDANSSQQE